MSRARREDSIIIEEYYTNPERFYKNLCKLARIVLHQHYNYVRPIELQEDLVEEAVVKAINLCLDGNFDPTRSSIRNYLYTGMRNEMQNIMYRRRNLIPVEEVRYTEEEAYKCDYQDALVIDDDLVYSICDKFFIRGNYHNLLIARLRKYGIDGEDTDLIPPKKPDKRLLDAIFAEYVWRAC